MGESAEDRPRVASLALLYEAKPSDAGVNVEDPRQLPEAPYGLHPHDDECPEDSDGVPWWPSRSGGVVAAE